MNSKLLLCLALILNFVQPGCLFAQTSPIANGAIWSNGLPVVLSRIFVDYRLRGN
jgi:hypothetical protein